MGKRSDEFVPGGGHTNVRLPAALSSRQPANGCGVHWVNNTHSRFYRPRVNTASIAKLQQLLIG